MFGLFLSNKITKKRVVAHIHGCEVTVGVSKGESHHVPVAWLLLSTRIPAIAPSLLLQPVRGGPAANYEGGRGTTVPCVFV